MIPSAGDALSIAPESAGASDAAAAGAAGGATGCKVVECGARTVNGGFGNFGIDAQNMAALYVENCVISNYNAANQVLSPYLGIKFEPSAPSSQMFVTNTITATTAF